MNFDQLIAAIVRGFARLTHFGGRDRRAQFWPYALCIWFAGAAVVMIVAIPVMFANIFDMMANMEQMARDNPQDWIVQRSNGGVQISYVGNDPAVIARLMPDVTLFFSIVAGFSLVMVALLAAALTRRLHDRGYSGWWLMIPFALLAGGFANMMRIFPHFVAGVGNDPVPADFMADFWSMVAINIAWLVSLFLLVVALLREGDPAPNRYGPPASGNEMF